MSKGFLNQWYTDRPDSRLKGKDKGLHIAPDRIEYIAKLRDEAHANYITAQNMLRETATNKRLKNKQATFELLANRAKNWFNCRSYDYFLYRVGESAKFECKEGVEYELEVLRSETSDLLLTLDKYNGYNDIYWYYGGGCERWREAGEPDFPRKDEFIREDLGSFFI